MNVLKIPRLTGLAVKERKEARWEVERVMVQMERGLVLLLLGSPPHSHEKYIRSGKEREGANRNRYESHWVEEEGLSGIQAP